MMPVRRLILVAGSSLPMILALRVSEGAGLQAKKVVPATGASSFAQKCASCHGKNGVGGPGFPKPLVGSRSVDELGRFIAQSMPPGPKKTPLTEAKSIAAYMYGAFYSPLAQEKNRPPRVALSRLTVRQFKNAVADLIGWSPRTVPTDGAHGLRAEYFKARDFDRGNRVMERVDPEVRFDFGTEGPVAGKFDPHNFSIAWDGSLFAPDSGDYELIIQSDHAARLWFNGAPQPLIDAFVKSGNENEFRAPITLLGGRTYPLRLEFTKATQGVNDDDKKKGKPAPKASVAFLWRRPKRVAEPIPSRDLYPSGAPSIFVVSTPFPADDRSIGYERGNTVTKEWDDATTSAALETASYLTDNLAGRTGVPDNAPDRKEKLKAYCRGFVERAFRRPLTPDVIQTYVDKQFEVAATPEMAVKRVVIFTLKSPRFLYREISPSPRDPYAVASQLSFGLWDSLPDDDLRRAAASGELATSEGVSKQATRLANDPRAWNKLRDFLLLWLKVDEIPDIVKSQALYPGFDAATAADLRTSFELYLEANGWDYQKLMLSPTEFLNGRLSKFYGGNLPADAPFQAIEDKDRTGVLTQPYVMSRFAYLAGSSPIHRGVLVARNMLGRVLSPPPAAFVPLAASAHPDFTTRQRVSLQTKPEMCTGCHGLINPLGFTFEKYDAIGRVRVTDNDKPVDASGSYKSRAGTVVKFNDAGDLARYLASSDEAHAAFVEKLFQHLVKQPVRAYGTGTLDELQRSFAKDRYSIRSLMVSIMVATASPATKASGK